MKPSEAYKRKAWEADAQKGAFGLLLLLIAAVTMALR